MRQWVALAVLLLGPAAGAQDAVEVEESTPVTLFFHIINVQDFPINTQEPDPAWTEDATLGPGATTLTCVHDTTGTATGGVTSQSFNTFYGYGAPNVVEYASAARSDNGDPRTHPERGLAADVHVDPRTRPSMKWYVSVGEPTSGSDGPPAAPTPLPNVVVRATIRAGDHISIADTAYNEGKILMQGSTPPVTLMADQVHATPGGPTTGVTALGLVGGRWLYEFDVPLTIEDAVLPKADGFNVRMDAFMDNPNCDPNGGTLQPNFAVHSSPLYRPRLEFAIKEAFTIEYAHARWVGDDLVLFLSAGSVWGAYDIDEAGIGVDVVGPGDANFERQEPVQRTHVHGQHQATVEMTWAWKGANKTAPNGHYDVVITAPNRQHTATLEVRIAFDRAPANDLPALGAPLAVLGLAALAVALRRR